MTHAPAIGYRLHRSIPLLSFPRRVQERCNYADSEALLDESRQQVGLRIAKPNEISKNLTAVGLRTLTQPTRQRDRLNDARARQTEDHARTEDVTQTHGRQEFNPAKAFKQARNLDRQRRALAGILDRETTDRDDEQIAQNHDEAHTRSPLNRQSGRQNRLNIHGYVSGIVRKQMLKRGIAERFRVLETL